MELTTLLQILISETNNYPKTSSTYQLNHKQKFQKKKKKIIEIHTSELSHFSKPLEPIKTLITKIYKTILLVKLYTLIWGILAFIIIFGTF